MRVERIAHDESHGSNPNQNGAAFSQNDRQSDFPRHRHGVAALGHFQEIARQISDEHMDGESCPRACFPVPTKRLLRNNNCADQLTREPVA